jgi:cytochrome c5
MKNKTISMVRGLSLVGMAALFVVGPAMAESRADVLERIRPVGRVSVVGQPEPAAAPAPAVAAAPAPAAEEAPAVEAAPAAEPAPAVAAAGGETIYKTACFACHDGQLPMSPKLGDKEKWAPRIAKGKEALYASAMNGVAGTPMPPRGNCATCSDEDLRAAVDYMISKAQ